MIERLVVASHNPDKVVEIEEILDGLFGGLVRGLSWPEVVETGATLEENARLKARAVAGYSGLPSLADDTGLEVDALNGQPGVETARFSGPDATYQSNVDCLLEVLAGVDDRRARFRTVVVLAYPDGREIMAEGVLDGSIATSPRGSGGFGYDPIFEVAGRTLAEMDSKNKNMISHRSRAIRALAAALQERNLAR